MVMGERTQDTRAPRGGDYREGDSGGMGGRPGNHCMGQGRGDLGMLLERGHLGGREPWAVLGEGADPEGKRNSMEREPKRGPHQFHPRSPCPALPPCSVSQTH